MSFLNALPLWQWLLFGGVPIGIVLLYFLKLKRRPVTVPSTYLWSRTLEDYHVNTIWQRLRRSLLLFLQLLFVAAAAIALVRPGWSGWQLSGNRFIFLIDHSASMSATDRSPTRLAHAKQQALALAAQMKPGDAAMVIAFADTAQVVQTYTASRSALRLGIERIEPTHRSTDVRDALRAAAGLANPERTRLDNDQSVDESLPATLYIFSDGAFPAVPEFALGNLNPVFIPIGDPDAANVGIVAFETDRNPDRPEQLQAFASVGNFGPQPVTVLLELWLDDRPRDLVELEIDAGAERGWQFDLPDLEQGVLKLLVETSDPFSADDTAFAVINRPQQSRLLVVTSGNDALLAALQTQEVGQCAHVEVIGPDQLGHDDYRRSAAAGEYDGIIYDRCQPETLPQANTLFLGALPPGGAWDAGPPEGRPTIIDVDRAHPMTQLVDMNAILIAAARVLQPPPGGTVLLDADRGPLLAIAPRDGFEDAVLGFSLLDAEEGQVVPNTNWFLRPSFPVFIYNTCRYLGRRDSLTADGLRPGNSITYRSNSSVDSITITHPQGDQHRTDRRQANEFVYAGTEQLGVYELREGASDVVAHRFAVNLCDARESDLQTRSELELGHEIVTGRSGLQASRRELWQWAILCALAILLLEWYIYHRRVLV